MCHRRGKNASTPERRQILNIHQLQLELDRIPTRNLGRDDRIISSHGKEVRQPFLALDVVSFLAGLPVHFKSDPRLNPGFGDKMLLRLAVRVVPGVKVPSPLPRRIETVLLP